MTPCGTQSWNLVIAGSLPAAAPDARRPQHRIAQSAGRRPPGCCPLRLSCSACFLQVEKRIGRPPDGLLRRGFGRLLPRRRVAAVQGALLVPPGRPPAPGALPVMIGVDTPEPAAEARRAGRPRPRRATRPRTPSAFGT